MKIRLLMLFGALALQACSGPPKPPEPSGQWVPVNQPATQSPQQSAMNTVRTDSK